MYKLLKLFFRENVTTTADLLALVTAILFIAHPIHVEAVANIKGRDEIMALLCSLSATYLLFRFEEQPLSKYLWYAGGLFFYRFAIQREFHYFFRDHSDVILLFQESEFDQSGQDLLPILVATVLFLVLRTAVIGTQTGNAPIELMNNPFLKLEGGKYIPFSFNEKMATIFFTLGKYLQLLLFPHPLTHDYYPRHIEIMSFSDLSAVFSLLAYCVLLGYGIFLTAKKHIAGYAILFYLFSLSIVSNLIFPIGTNMSERFLFMPSVGFCLLAAWLLMKLPRSSMTMLAGVIVLAFGYKTITRNMVWKDNFTLFTTDVLVSKNSAKLCNAVGGDLIRVYSEEKTL